MNLIILQFLKIELCLTHKHKRPNCNNFQENQFFVTEHTHITQPSDAGL